MKTLHVRNVPDEVVDRLKWLAARELAQAWRRADNAEVLDALPDLKISPSAIVTDLEADRAAT